MSVERHKALLAKFPALLLRPDPEAIRPLFTEDFQLHVPNYPDWPRGHDGAIRMFAQMNALFPGMLAQIEDMFGEHDRVCVRWRYKGTQSGAFEGRVGAGARFEAIGHSIYRFTDGRVAEDWGADVILPAGHAWRTF